MDLNFCIGVDTKPAADLLPALFQAREQLTGTPLFASSLEHLLPVSEARISGYEVIERIRGHVLLAFDTACVKECAASLKVRVLPNEIIRQ